MTDWSGAEGARRGHDLAREQAEALAAQEERRRLLAHGPITEVADHVHCAHGRDEGARLDELDPPPWAIQPCEHGAVGVHEDVDVPLCHFHLARWALEHDVDELVEDLNVDWLRSADLPAEVPEAWQRMGLDGQGRGVFYRDRDGRLEALVLADAETPVAKIAAPTVATIADLADYLAWWVGWSDLEGEVLVDAQEAGRQLLVWSSSHSRDCFEVVYP